MGITVRGLLYCECSEEELLLKLNRFRNHALALSPASVSEIVKVDPAYDSLLMTFLTKTDFSLHPYLAERIARPQPGLADFILTLTSHLYIEQPKTMIEAHSKPAMDYIKAHPDGPYWKYEDLPETSKIGSPWLNKDGEDIGTYFTYSRDYVAFALTRILLCYGYALSVSPAEGCNSLIMPFLTFRSEDTLLWLGRFAVDTHRAPHFEAAHEMVCNLVDLAKAEGLIYSMEDTCNFYEHRSWSQSREAVAEDERWRGVTSKIMKPLIESLVPEGTEVSDPQTIVIKSGPEVPPPPLDTTIPQDLQLPSTQELEK